MDIKTFLEKLREHVACSVCMNVFTVPKQLPCLHSFCLHCLNEIAGASARKGIITCPECRREVTVPASGNFNELPTDFNLNSLIDTLAVEDCSAISVKCGNCEKRNAKCVYCFNCSAFLCEECRWGHDIMRANRCHRVVAIQDFKDQDVIAVLQRPAFCLKKNHESEQLKFFCQDCKTAICNLCALTHQEGHAKVLLEDAFSERQIKIKEAIISQKQYVTETTRKINEISQNCVKIHQEVLNAKQRMEDFVTIIKEIAEAKRQEVLKKVDEQAKEALDRLENQKCELEGEVRVIKKAIERSETLLKRCTNVEIVQLGAVPCEEVRVGVQQLNRDPDLVWHVVFKENQRLLKDVKSGGIGSIHSFFSKTNARESTAQGSGTVAATVGLEAVIMVRTRNSNEVMTKQGSDVVALEFGKHDCQVTEPQITENKDGTYKISYFAKEAGTCQASVKVNGEHVCGSPFEVKFQPREFGHSSSFGKFGHRFGELNHPWGLAVNARNEIAVCDTRNNRVQVFNTNGHWLRALGTKGDGQGNLNFPNGIAWDSDGTIFVVDCNNHRVNKFNSSGHYLGQIGNKGRLHHQLWNPRGISVDSKGNLIVTDTGNQRIKIFSSRGQILGGFCGGGVLEKPYDAVEKHGKLFVSDTADHSVKVLDMKGAFLFKFGKLGESDGEFNQPRGLSFDKAGHLVVCDSENNRVQLFDLTGKFVTKFGTKGKNFEGLNKPINAVVLSDGRIAVSDFYNHQIHLFQ